MIKKPKLLIVEDDPIIAEDIADICSYAGYSICGTAYSAGQALISMDECFPDLVLLDVNLGAETTGIDVAEHLVKKTNIPFIFITSYSDKKTLDQVKTLSPLAYLVKPFSPNQLLTTIELGWDQFSRKKSTEIEFDLIQTKVLSPINEREKDVIISLYKGMSTAEIAKSLFISQNTVKFHIKNIYSKFDVHSKVELLAKIRDLLK